MYVLDLVCLVISIVVSTKGSSSTTGDNNFDSLKRFERLNNLLKSVNDPLDFTNISDISEKCLLQHRLYLKHLDDLQLWALKIYDSSAKTPSSILNGNVNQFGDFDQCLSAKLTVNDDTIQGRYCLLNFQIMKPEDDRLKLIHRLAHSNYAFESKINDTGSIIPRFSSINWAICVPSGCLVSDVRQLLDKRIKPRFKDAGFDIDTSLQNYSCQTEIPTSQLITKSNFLAILAFMIVLLITCFSTMYDYMGPVNKNDILISFSLIKNTKALFSVKRPKDDIKVVHGIRFFAAAMIYASHKALMIFYDAYVNRTAMAETSSKHISALVRPSSLYTDIFLMLSGLLFSYSFFGRLNRSSPINLVQDYISRLFRLLPTLAAVILFCTQVLPLLGSGPQWNEIVGGQSDICQKTWWRSLLFMANYFGFKDICLAHTHHIGIDTQLFFVSPLFVWIIWKWGKSGIYLLTYLGIFSAILRIHATIKYDLSNYIHYGMSITRMIDTADKTYTLPPHRISSYLIGILLGFYLRIDINNNNININNERNLKVNYLNFSPVIALGLFLVSLFGTAYMVDVNYKYNSYDAAWFAGVSPILLCVSLYWFIYATHFGYKSILSRFLSSKYFLITTRLAYSAYLVQFPMFFYIIGSTKSSDYFSVIRKNIEISEIVLLLLLSTMLTLLIDYPFQNIRNYYFKRSSSVKLE